MVQDRIYNYFERNPQLHVLFIFDRMNIIQNELDDMKEWNDDYIYKVFDGAWFNAKYAIENEWKDKHVVLLFPEQVYPHTEEQQLSFPLLDMLKALASSRLGICSERWSRMSADTVPGICLPNIGVCQLLPSRLR